MFAIGHHQSIVSEPAINWLRTSELRMPASKSAVDDRSRNKGMTRDRFVAKRQKQLVFLTLSRFDCGAMRLFLSAADILIGGGRAMLAAFHCMQEAQKKRGEWKCSHKSERHCPWQMRMQIMAERFCPSRRRMLTMKIAQVSPVFERVPPKAYGGTERVVSYLTEELIRQGHDVTLFATGDSITQARLVSPVDESRRFDPRRQEWLMYHTIMMDQVAEMADEFDVIHFHTDFLHFPYVKHLATPYVTTLHGRLDYPELVPLYRHFRATPLVSISDSQRSPLPWANWQATVHHGLPPASYTFHSHPQDYFAFVGRISPEKRVDRAIEIALQCDMPLTIAAKIDKPDQDYFKEQIKPLFNHPLIEYLGEIGDEEKCEVVGNARALLFPIDWPEPFGLVMIEAFACGTPVIAYRNGAVPEIMENGVTGFVVSNQEQAVQAGRDIESIDRARCRQAFERRFTASRMAQNYLNVYRTLQRNVAKSAGEMHG
jgi:glycosyltransferase involved in cell wall biosynthesis